MTILVTTGILLTTLTILGSSIASATTETEEDSPTTPTTLTEEPVQSEPSPAEPPEEEITITEEPTVPGATTGGLATETPAPQEPGPIGPQAVSNATLQNAGGNQTGVTTQQQVVSGILNDIRSTETNQSEIAQLEEKLPILVDALNQANGTATADFYIKYECTSTYDKDGNRVSRICTLTIGWD